jgi:hypothetical protein
MGAATAANGLTAGSYIRGRVTRQLIEKVFQGKHNRTTVSIPPSRKCQFPQWSHVRRPDTYLFCNAATQSGSPYCEEHHKICYQPNSAKKDPLLKLIKTVK